MALVPRNALWERYKMAGKSSLNNAMYQFACKQSQNKRIAPPVKNQSGKKNSYEVNYFDL